MSHRTWNMLFWLNHIVAIIYVSRLYRRDIPLDIQGAVLLPIVSFMLIDVTYISACNVKGNKVVSLFSGLLLLNCWYMLLLLADGGPAGFLFAAAGPITWYASVRFVLLFLFQGSGYRFRKAANGILLTACLASLIGIGISDRVYAFLYGVQFLVSVFCFLFVTARHWSRVVFVLKSERKCILLSGAFIFAAFLIYCYATADIPYHLSNFGIYIPVFLFGLSVHGIVVREHNSYPLSTIFGRRQAIAVIAISLFVVCLIVLPEGGSLYELCIAVNLLFAFLYLCNIVLEQRLKEGQSVILKESRYYAALRQMQREEALKTDFANYLHDEILQDILSVQYMMTKVHRLDVQDAIREILDNLSANIRGQMHDYHPVILQNLTIKENYLSLIEAVAQSFPQRDMKVSFECSDSLFIVEPYNLLVYRLLKELLTNVYKHSDGSQAWVALSLEKDVIRLRVADNGTADAVGLASADKTKHKGLASVSEQISGIGGAMEISGHAPQGVCVQIEIPMKGDVSYQYFISR